MDAPEIARFLKTVRLFSEFSEPDLLALAARLRERKLKQEQVLFREGDPGEEMYFVRSGTILVSKSVIGRVEQVLARMTTGDFFGEMTLIDRSPRSATIQAETPATLLAFDRDNLNLLVELNPRAAAGFFRAMVQVFIDRLRTTGALVTDVTRWGLEATGLDPESST